MPRGLAISCKGISKSSKYNTFVTRSAEILTCSFCEALINVIFIIIYFKVDGWLEIKHFKIHYSWLIFPFSRATPGESELPLHSEVYTQRGKTRMGEI